jgi:hypothetical protein
MPLWHWVFGMLGWPLFLAIHVGIWLSEKEL